MFSGAWPFLTDFDSPVAPGNLTSATGCHPSFPYVIVLLLNPPRKLAPPQ